MDLAEQYKLMHAAGHFPGHSIVAHVDEIDNLIRKSGSKTILDYGCGKGEQYSIRKLHKFWGVEPTLYDIATYPEKPEGTFDGVICTDVLEHVPEELVKDTIAELFSYARKFVFMSICTRDAKKTLPDGRNAHLTVRPQQWWLSIIYGLEPKIEWKVEWNS